MDLLSSTPYFTALSGHYPRFFMDPSLPPSFFFSKHKQLKVAIVGGGIGGLSAAIALRRAGHVGSPPLQKTVDDVSDLFFGPAVEIFERRSFDVEVSSFLACAANGRRL